MAPNKLVLLFLVSIGVAACSQPARGGWGASSEGVVLAQVPAGGPLIAGSEGAFAELSIDSTGLVRMFMAGGGREVSERGMLVSLLEPVADAKRTPDGASESLVLLSVDHRAPWSAVRELLVATQDPRLWLWKCFFLVLVPLDSGTGTREGEIGCWLALFDPARAGDGFGEFPESPRVVHVRRDGTNEFDVNETGVDTNLPRLISDAFVPAEPARVGPWADQDQVFLDLEEGCTWGTVAIALAYLGDVPAIVILDGVPLHVGVR
jgi:hypothetical protein